MTTVEERADKQIEAICRRHNTPPAAAAIIPGAIRPAQVTQNLPLLRHPIPAQLWTDLREAGLPAERAPTPA